jgi:hypothetical protein
MEESGATVSDPPTQAEVQALRDRCQDLTEDAQALSTFVHTPRGQWSRWVAAVLVGIRIRPLGKDRNSQVYMECSTAIRSGYYVD